MDLATALREDFTRPSRVRAKGAPAKALSHNLNGQRLGRKGRDTRARIVSALNELLAEPEEVPISLSAVARKASLGMSSLYLYFKDMTELLLAALEPVMATATEEFDPLLRELWPDDQLRERSYAFVSAYHAFWVRHSRLLHLRNTIADARDERMLMHRVRSAQYLMRLLVAQMGGERDPPGTPVYSMATALMTGLERVVTVTTDNTLQRLLQARFSSHEHLLEAETRLIEFGIRDCRANRRN